MKNYLLTIILVSICIGIIDIISPDNSSLSKYTKSICLLIILCIIISPINKVIKTIDEGFLNDIKDSILIDIDEEKDRYENLLHTYLNDHSIQELKKQIKEILNNKFEVPEGECDIKIITSYINDTITLNEVRIILSGTSIFKNPYSIEEYFEEILQCKCTVAIKQMR